MQFKDNGDRPSRLRRSLNFWVVFRYRPYFLNIFTSYCWSASPRVTFASVQTCTKNAIFCNIVSDGFLNSRSKCSSELCLNLSWSKFYLWSSIFGGGFRFFRGRITNFTSRLLFDVLFITCYCSLMFWAYFVLLKVFIIVFYFINGLFKSKSV